MRYLLVVLFALMFTLFAYAQVKGPIPAFESWPAQTPDGTFAGNLESPNTACRKSISPGVGWTCRGGVMPDDNPLAACKNGFIVSGLPSLAAGAKIVGPIGAPSYPVYECSSPPQYPYLLCHVSQVTGTAIPPRPLYYHAHEKYERSGAGVLIIVADNSPQAGYCVDQYDAPVFEMDSHKIYTCPAGWTIAQVSGKFLCNGACPPGEQVSIDEMKCSPFRHNLIAEDTDTQKRLLQRWSNIGQVIQRNKTVMP